MKIEILCTDGSPLGVTVDDIYGIGQRGIGVGGSEYALLTMCEAWHNEGYEVVLYNNPSSAGSPFEQRGVTEFDPKGTRDVLIIFRSPNPRGVVAKGLKVWWSCDQYTVGNFKTFAPLVDKIVCISPYHRDYFKNSYEIRNTIVIDLPVRADDYVEMQPKVEDRIIFTSVPDRGLSHLWRSWMIIKSKIPNASLVITSDYRLWGTTAGNEKHKIQWMNEDNVQFMGAIQREHLIRQELAAEVLAYPCNYDELFCVSVAEAQYAGVHCVTSNHGALGTTNMRTIIAGNPNDIGYSKRFADAVVKVLSDKNKLEEDRKQLVKQATFRFHPDTILKEWEDKVFT